MPVVLNKKRQAIALNVSIFGACTIPATGESFSFDGSQVEINMEGSSNTATLITVANLDYLSVCDLSWETMDLDPEDCDFLVEYMGQRYKGNTLEEFQASLKAIVKLINVTPSNMH